MELGARIGKQTPSSSYMAAWTWIFHIPTDCIVLFLQFFVEVNYIQQCQVLNTIYEHILRKKLIYCNNSPGLYTQVFKENLEDTDFDVKQFSG